MAKSKSDRSDAAQRPTVAPDKLEVLQAKVARLRDIELEIEQLSERSAALSKEHHAIANSELPELLFAAGTDHVGIPPSGNLPGYDAKVAPYYRAGIAASWDEEKRRQAFQYLESIGAADLIKTQITIMLPREQREEAKKLVERLERFEPEVKENVHAGTLTAWLKEQSNKGVVVELDLIGGEVGTTVKIKPRKEK
jgi:hypothetical protein